MINKEQFYNRDNWVTVDCPTCKCGVGNNCIWENDNHTERAFHMPRVTIFFKKFLRESKEAEIKVAEQGSI